MSAFWSGGLRFCLCRKCASYLHKPDIERFKCGLSEGSRCYNLGWFTDPDQIMSRSLRNAFGLFRWHSPQFQMSQPGSELELQIERKTIKEVFRQALVAAAVVLQAAMRRRLARTVLPGLSSVARRVVTC